MMRRRRSTPGRAIRRWLLERALQMDVDGAPIAVACVPPGIAHLLTDRAFSRLATTECEELVGVRGVLHRHRQVRARRVDVEPARPAPVVQAANLLAAEVADPTEGQADEVERVARVEVGGESGGARGAAFVEVEVAAGATVTTSLAEAVATIALELPVAVDLKERVGMQAVV